MSARALVARAPRWVTAVLVAGGFVAVTGEWAQAFAPNSVVSAPSSPSRGSDPLLAAAGARSLDRLVSLEAPGTVASPLAALRHATTYLDEQVQELAPGIEVSDLELVTNHLDRGMRTLGFEQRHHGVRVRGATLSLRYRSGRLMLVRSRLAPASELRAEPPLVSVDEARERVRSALEREGVRGTAVDEAAPLDLLAGRPARLVRRVVADALEPRGRWEFDVDASSGTILDRRSVLRFAEAQVLFDVPDRWPGGGRQTWPARSLQARIGGNASMPLTADLDGTFEWPGADPLSVSLRPSGTWVLVQDVGRPAMEESFVLEPGQAVTWSVADDAALDAQLSAYAHVEQARAFAQTLAPDLSLFRKRLGVNVNLDEVCNAFTDGYSLNFFRGGRGCENTARLADVVRHEFGHVFHAHAVLPGVGELEGALGEGLADYFAATMADDSGMGRGFYRDDRPLREIDPPDSEATWPEDAGEIHAAGKIVAGALWDLRKELRRQHGPLLGTSLADQLYLEGMRRAVDMPSMLLEVLAADDDDGDLTNGTPNSCAIRASFGRHGLLDRTVQLVELGVLDPEAKSYDIRVELGLADLGCPEEDVARAELEWRWRSRPDLHGSVPLQQKGSALLGTMPALPDGVAFEYRVRLHLTSGAVITEPANAADPYLTAFVGRVTPILCEGFEGDPGSRGWSHGLATDAGPRAQDDWAWGTPRAPASSGDPVQAFAGSSVLGTDLGGSARNGKYASRSWRQAASPVIDVSGHKHLRLQFRRWLQVEDGNFDQARVLADGEVLWENARAEGAGDTVLTHRDAAWRFQDFDLGTQGRDGALQLGFELQSDGGFELGGWNLDEVCVVAWEPLVPPDPVCGDGFLDPGEGCDAGKDNSDRRADACRPDCQPARCGDGVVDAAEACDGGGTVEPGGCNADCSGSLPPDLGAISLSGAGGCAVSEGGSGTSRGPTVATFTALALLALRQRRRRRGAL